MKRTYLRRRSAFTIVEVLVAAVVFLLAVVPIFGLFHGQARQASQTEYLIGAQTHLLAALDERTGACLARRFSPDTLEPRSTTRSVDWGTGPMDVVETSSVTPVEDVTGLWRVEVAVQWNESRGGAVQSRSLMLPRLVYDTSR